MRVKEMLTAIADKIRSYTGKTSMMCLADMPAQIEAAAYSAVGALVSNEVKDLVLKDGCSKIRPYMFQYSGVTSVRVAKSIDGVYRQAFQGSKSLERVVFEGNVGRIAVQAFAQCHAVKTYRFEGSVRVPILEALAFQDMAADCIIWVPSALYEQWIAADEWSALADHIQPIPVA